MGLWKKIFPKSHWAPKTVAGKILKGVVTVGVPAAAAVTGVGAAAGAVTGAGLLGGVITAASKVKNVVKSGISGATGIVDKVATGAGNLVSGITKEQRQILKNARADIRADTQKVRLVEKLVNEGLSVKDAAARASVPLSALAGMFGLPAVTEENVQEYALADEEVSAMTTKKSNKGLLLAGAGALALLVLPNLFKR
ncbi:MAG: hypothetical protein U9O65_00805 [Thermotogota bacterium]|nr:hypothetical protein [Thermotogota bacterium]